jgi:hypothetical protein
MRVGGVTVVRKRVFTGVVGAVGPELAGAWLFAVLARVEPIDAAFEQIRVSVPCGGAKGPSIRCSRSRGPAHGGRGAIRIEAQVPGG